MHYYDDDLTLYELISNLFMAAVAVCFLWAINRSARGTLLRARVKAYEELSDAYTPEEREALIHRIKADSLRF